MSNNFVSNNFIVSVGDKLKAFSYSVHPENEAKILIKMSFVSEDGTVNKEQTIGTKDVPVTNLNPAKLLNKIVKRFMIVDEKYFVIVFQNELYIQIAV